MSRIILSAMKHGKPLAEVKGYEEQQEKFWNHPVKLIPKEIERAERAAKATKQAENIEAPHFYM